VKRDLLLTARVLVPPTLGLVAVVAFTPGRIGLAARIYVLLLCGVALALALAALRRAYPPATPLRRPRTPRSRARPRPPTLARLEQQVALGAASAFEFHRGLRPRLRALAGGLLADRRGISLDEAPGPSCEVVGHETWELVRHDRPPPEDRLARGLPLEDLSRVIESLERI
jgi:hypothetical protein